MYKICPPPQKKRGGGSSDPSDSPPPLFYPPATYTTNSSLMVGEGDTTSLNVGSHCPCFSVLNVQVSFDSPLPLRVIDHCSAKSIIHNTKLSIKVIQTLLHSFPYNVEAIVSMRTIEYHVFHTKNRVKTNIIHKLLPLCY